VKIPVLLPSLFISIAAAAQVHETVNVNVIEVPVTVVDRSGNPVRGLTAANFALFDNGKKRDITSFDVVDFASPDPTNALSPLNPVARRTFLLLFDLGFSSPNSLARAQEAARDFLKISLQPRDIVAVGTIQMDRGCRLLTSFTTDRELVRTAIDKPASFRSADPLGISNQTLAFVSELEQPGMANLGVTDVAAQAASETQMGAHALDATLAERDAARSATYMNEGLTRQRVERQVDALGELAQILGPMPGRKQVVLLSEGLPGKYLVGRSARDSKEEREQAERIINGSWASIDARMGDADTDQRYGNSAAMTLLERMTRYFRRSDVVLHAIDLQGARVQGDTFEGARVNTNDGLAVLARTTGGELFQNVNSIGENFRRFMHQQEVVYVLAFQAPTEKVGAFHELNVKMTGIPRGSRIDYRGGYYEGGRPGDRTLTDAEVVMNDMPQNGIGVAAFAGAFPTTGARAQVPVILEIDGRDLAEGTMLNGSADIAIYAFDEKGTVYDRLYQTMSFDPGKVADRLRAGGVKYYGTLSLPPGKYAIKTLVRIAKSDRRGYARIDVVVPRSGEFGVVPFIVDEQSSDWLMVKGSSHDRAGAGYPFQIDGEALVPAVLPRIHAGESRKVALFVQNADPDDLVIEALPKATILSMVKASGMTKIMLQVGSFDATVRSLDIVVQKQERDARRVRLPVVVQ
jgi:VWFA-related protein